MFRAEKQGAIDIICCADALTQENLEDFTTAVDSCLEAGQPMLVLDLADTPLIDSLGLEMLVELSSRVDRMGGAIKLAALQPLLIDALRITGVGERYHAFPTVKEAMGSFTQ